MSSYTSDPEMQKEVRGIPDGVIERWQKLTNLAERTYNCGLLTSYLSPIINNIMRKDVSPFPPPGILNATVVWSNQELAEVTLAVGS